MSLSYYHFTDRDPQAQKVGIPVFADPQIDALTDKRNPVYNFDAQFIEKFQSIDQTKLAQAVPYISLCSLDTNGKVVTDFNVTFFQKGVDMTQVSKTARYADRPLLSLQNISISETLAAGGGQLSWTNVTMNLKLHKPDFVTNNALISLMFSGLPMRLVYGWSSIAKEDFLGVSDVLLFNLKDYTLTFDLTGQALLTLNGLGHSDTFSNVYVGDNAEAAPADNGVPVDLVSDDSPVPIDLMFQDVPDIQQDNLYRQQQRISKYVSYANTQPIRQNSEGTRDPEILDFMGELYYDVADRISADTRLAFYNALDTLKKKCVSRTDLFNDVATKNEDGTISQGDCVTLHDIISTLCGPTIEKLQGTIIPGDRDYRIVYGSFNENAGDWAGQCVGLFPIHWKSFNDAFKTVATNGMPVPSLEFVFRLLVDQFLSNRDYWRSNILRTDDQSKIDFPKVVCQVTTHIADGTANASGNKKEVVQINFYDTNFKVPFTQLKLDGVTATSEQAQIDACIGNPATIPVIRFGSANSCVKSISMESFSDPTYKAYLMNRYSGIASVRQSIVANALAPPVAKKAPFIPFKGTMEVIGHIDWKVGRYFYLASGIFFIDGVYLINEVHSELDKSGFRTSISFSRH